MRPCFPWQPLAFSAPGVARAGAEAARARARATARRVIRVLSDWRGRQLDTLDQPSRSCWGMTNTCDLQTAMVRNGIGHHLAAHLRFKAKGWFLDDLCHVPVNGMDKAERDATCRKSEQPLANRLRTMNPRKVVVIQKSIEANVRRAIALSGCSASIEVVPFPGLGNQGKFLARMAVLLRWLPALDREG